jgi:3-phosphoshikimate 1-carboxyvinyltransferase
MALGALLGEVTCLSVGVNPTRTGMINVLRRMGVEMMIKDLPTQGNEPVADITVYRSILSSVTIEKEEIPTLVDEIPIIAVLCCFANGTSYIRGAEELRVKESDRIRTTVEMIRALGGKEEELPDGIVIEGTGGLYGGTVRSEGDHRIAMSGAVALTASKVGGEIENAECVDISFPDFYQKLEGGR